MNRAIETIAPEQLGALKAGLQRTWAAGDYSRIGTTLQIVGERLAESMDLAAGMRVLDIAAGNGNASLAAARRWCDVTATDIVPALLEQLSVRATAEGLDIACRAADAENLPFADGVMDATMSTFGAMFAPDQARAAAELVRVTRPASPTGHRTASSGASSNCSSTTIRRRRGCRCRPAGVSRPSSTGTSPATAPTRRSGAATMFSATVRRSIG